MFAAIVILGLISPLQEREVFRSVATADAPWSQSSSWKRTNRIPSAHDRVRISGTAGETRSVVVPAGDVAEASSLFVGAEGNGTGVLSVFGDLRVGTAEVTDPQAGRIFVGRNNGTGYLTQRHGVVTADFLRIGHDRRSLGEYHIEDASLHIAKSLDVATGPRSSGLLKLKNAASVETKRLLLGEGNARIRLEAAGSDTPSVIVSGRSELAGALRVALLEPDLPDEIVLIQRGGISQGGFRRVRISSPAGKHYELTYFGGDGNDVALRNVAPSSGFEPWRTTNSLTSAPLADPDLDGVPNVGEYKLGCCPRTHEGPAFRHGKNSAGLPFIQFVERTDRTDVRTVPQWSTDGRVWSSEGLDVRTSSRRDRTQIVRVTASKHVVRFRLLFELLPAPDIRPNVLFVTIDDLNDWIEPLGGHPQSLTPNLNRIAARGVLFTQAHSPAVLCNPARVALLTGRLPSNTGVYDNEPNLRDSPALQDAVTIPENFKAAGYHISGGGKVFHRNPQIDQWDEYFPSKTKNRPGSPTPTNVPLNGITNSHGRFDWGIVNANDTDMGDYKVASWVSNRLARHKPGQPFFLACGIFRPHLPFYVPAEYFDPWRLADIRLPTLLTNDTDDLPPAAHERLNFYPDHQSVIDQKQWQRAIHAYLASIYFADQQLGSVLDALDSSPHLRNTIVVIMSDHGWQFGEKTAWRKNTLWDRATRVPLIVVAPGITTPGRRCDEVVSLIDIYPTLNELCSLPAVSPLDGQSLVPQLTEPDKPRSEPVITTQLYQNHSVRTKRWRYTRYYNGDEELYDHSDDSNEWHNLAERPDYEPVLIELRRHLPEVDHPLVGRRRP